MKTYLNLRQAILAILLPTLLLSGGIAAYLVFRHRQETCRRADPTYEIKAIVQRTSGQGVSTNLLMELLDLSTDQPSNLCAFSVIHAEKKLKSWGVFKDIQISKVFPDTLVIDYKMKEPLAYLQNRSNTAISAEGDVIPFHPFYSPKKIPVVRLGQDLAWGDSANTDLIQLLNVIQLIRQELQHSIELVDFSEINNFNDQIIIHSRFKNKNRWLRLDKSALSNQIVHYKKILPTLLKWEEQNDSNVTVVDLRLPEVALINKGH